MPPSISEQSAQRALTHYIRYVAVETRAQLQQWVGVRNAIGPDPSTLAELEQSIRTNPQQIRLIATIDHTPVAVGCAVFDRHRAANEYWTQVRVVDGYRRLGVGSALLLRLVEYVVDQGAVALKASSRSDIPEIVAFLERFGLREIERDISLELPLSDFREPTRAQEARVRIVSLAERPDLRKAAHALERETSRDIPGEHTDGLSFEEWNTDLDSYPGMAPEQAFVALDGDDPVGIAFVVIDDGAPDRAIHDMTGVLRTHRGQGIAYALKLHTIAWARSRGLRALLTYNHEDNAPMQHINVVLGYRPSYSMLSFSAAPERVQERLRGNLEVDKTYRRPDGV